MHPKTAGWLGLTAIAVIAVTLLAVSTGPLDWLPFVAIPAPLVILIAVRHRLQVVPLSPTWIVALILAGVGIAGYLLTDQLSGLRGGGIVLSLPAVDRVRTAYVFGGSILAFSMGAALVALFTARRRKLSFDAIVVENRTRSLMLVAAIVPLAMILIAVGSALLDRDRYLAGALGSRELYALGQQLATASVALVGYVLAGGTKWQRTVALILLILYAGVLFSMGSRRLALAPLVFTLGALMANPARASRKLVVAGIASAALLPLPLFLRGSDGHGLVPYLAALGSFDLAEVDWLTTLNNVLIAFPIAGMTAFHANPIPLGNLAISLNPLPGEMAGWYQIAPSMTLNTWTPFSAVGELWNYGVLPAIAVWFCFGAVTALLDRVSYHFWRAGAPIFSLAVVGLAALFALQSLQYNVRSSSRLLLYAALIAVFGVVYVHLKGNSYRYRGEARRRSLRVVMSNDDGRSSEPRS